ncbi:MAG: hypothetical protein DGJ47_000373 [Rickettsiaceae bacterium]
MPKISQLDLEKPYNPSDFMHSLLSACVYSSFEPGDMLCFPEDDVKSKYNDYLENWIVHTVFAPEFSDDYYSALYINEKDNHAVLAHRGTNIVLGSLFDKDKSLKADFAEILNGEIGVQQMAAYESTETVLEILKSLNEHSERDYKLSFTGHSLGAWLSELSIYFCHTEFDYTDVAAVTFDSPGTGDHLSNFKSNINPNESFDTKKLNLKIYLSAPNLVNSCNRQVTGNVFRLHPKIDHPVQKADSILSDMLEYGEQNARGQLINTCTKIVKNLDIINKMRELFKEKENYAYTFLSLNGHFLDPIIECFDMETGRSKKCKQVQNWPLIEYKSYNVDSSIQEGVKSLFTYLPLIPNSVGNLLARPSAAIVSKFFPGETVKSMLGILIAFCRGDANVMQIVKSFKYLDFNSSDKGYKQIIPNSAKDKFLMSFDAKYKITDFNESQLKIPIVEGTVSKLLKRIKSRNISKLDVPDSVKKALLLLVKNYKLVDSKQFIVTDANFKLINKIKLILEYCPDLEDAVEMYKVRKIYELDMITKYSKLPTRPVNFIGREKVFRKIDEIFKTHKLVLISGFTGTGKTAAINEYAHRFKGQENVLIRWFKGTNDGIESEYRSLAEELGFNINSFIGKNFVGDNESNVLTDSTSSLDMNHLMSLVNSRITERDKKILFIFDNVDKSTDIAKYLKDIIDLPIQVLMTSKDSSVMSDDVQNIKLKPYTQYEAKRYLAEYLKISSTSQQIADLVSILLLKSGSILPSKLSRVTDILKRKQLDQNVDIEQSIEQYIDNFKNTTEKERDELLFKELLSDSKISFNLLRYAAYLDPNFINLKVLQKAADICDERLLEATEKLKALSLIELVQDSAENKGIKLHGVVKSNIMDYNNSNVMTKKELEDTLIHNMLFSIPKITADCDSDWQEAETFYPYVKYLLENHNFIGTDELAVIYQHMAQYEQIVFRNYDLELVNHQKALNIFEELYGAEDIRCLEENCKITQTYCAQGEYDKGLIEVDKILQFYDKGITAYDNVIADALYENGRLFYYVRRFNEALIFCEKAIKKYEDLGGDKNIKVARCHNLAGNIQLMLENHKDALDCYKQAKSILDTMSNEAYSDDKAKFLNNIALAYRKLDLPEKALEAYKTSLDIRKDMYNNSFHPEILKTENKLAEVYAELGMNEEAIVYYTNVLGLYQKFYPTSYKEIARCYEYVAYIYNKLEEYDKALYNNKRAVELLQDLYERFNNVDIIKPLQRMAYSFNKLNFKQSEQKVQATILEMKYTLIENDKNIMKNICKLSKQSQNFYAKNNVSTQDFAGYKYKSLAYKAISQMMADPTKCEVLPILKPVCNKILSTKGIYDIFKADIIYATATILDNVATQSAADNWSSGAVIGGASIAGDWGAKGYIEQAFTKSQLSNDEQKTLKFLCFEAICLGISSVDVKSRKYNCLDKFIENNPGIVQEVFTAHPEYFIDVNILSYCAKVDDNPDIFKFAKNYKALLKQNIVNYSDFQSDIKDEILMESNPEVLKTLENIERLSANDDWRSGILVSKPSLFGNWGVEGHINDLLYKFINDKISGIKYNPQNINLIMRACFKAICTGITQKPMHERKYNCLFQFGESHREAIQDIIQHKPEFFQDIDILLRCCQYIDHSQKQKFFDLYTKTLTKYKGAHLVKDQELFAQIAKSLPHLKTIRELAEKNHWDKNYPLSQYEKIDEEGIKYYIDIAQLKEFLGEDLSSGKTVEIAKKLCFQEICRGISLQIGTKNYDCLDEFIAQYSGIVGRISNHCPNFFVNPDILMHCYNEIPELSNYNKFLGYYITVIDNKLENYEEEISESLKKNLKNVCSYSSKGKWSSAKWYANEDNFKNKLVQDENIKNKIEAANILFLDSICRGINSVAINKRYYDCLDEFLKIKPDIVQKTFEHHPEFFRDEDILLRCIHHIDDSESDVKLLQAYTNLVVLPDSKEAFLNAEISNKLPLGKVMDLSAEGLWYGASSDLGVNEHISEAQLRNKLGQLFSRNNVEKAKKLYFKAICNGILSRDHGRDYTCLDEFVQNNKELVQTIYGESPQYFINKDILIHCRRFIDYSDIESCITPYTTLVFEDLVTELGSDSLIE